MNYRLLIVSTLCLFFNNIYAQSKIEKKLDKLWETNKKKCISKARYLIEKSKAEERSNYYLLKYHLLNAKDYRRKSQWNSVFRYAISGNEYSSQEWQNLRVDIKISAEEYFFELKPGEKDKFGREYVEVFQDSLLAFKQWLVDQEKKRAANVIAVVAEGTDSLRRVLLSIAQNLQGTPYKWAGEDPKGFDCSGFTRYVYKSVGIELPHNAQLQATLEEAKTKPVEMAQPGDLLFFGSKTSKGYNVAHAAILLSREQDSVKVIHCVGKGVCIEGDSISWDTYWKDRILFAKSLIGEN